VHALECDANNGTVDIPIGSFHAVGIGADGSLDEAVPSPRPSCSNRRTRQMQDDCFPSGTPRANRLAAW